MSTADEAKAPAPTRPDRQRRRKDRSRRRITVVVAVVLILGGLAIGAHIGWFYLRSSTKGTALTKQFHHEVAKAHATHAACAALSDTATGPQGLVAAPAIGLNAPVEGGDGDDVLNVAVGHVPGSVWPDEAGTTLLAAHDVSYFSQIDRLGVGQTVTFATPCTTYVYSVTGHQIVANGSPLYSSSSRSLLVLETCYPLNALYVTSQHYLVTAELQRAVSRIGTEPSILSVPPAPAVPAPDALAAEGLTLADNNVQLGLLDLAGTPSLAWQESPAPLNDEAAVLADYFAGLRSAEQNQAEWWAQLAPAVPFADTAPLRHARMTYKGALTPTLGVVNSTLVTADVEVNVEVTGGSAPGAYALAVQETVEPDNLIITAWSMTRRR